MHSCILAFCTFRLRVSLEFSGEQNVPNSHPGSFALKTKYCTINWHKNKWLWYCHNFPKNQLESFVGTIIFDRKLFSRSSSRFTGNSQNFYFLNLCSSNNLLQNRWFRKIQLQFNCSHNKRFHFQKKEREQKFSQPVRRVVFKFCSRW